MGRLKRRVDVLESDLRGEAYHRDIVTDKLDNKLDRLTECLQALANYLDVELEIQPSRTIKRKLVVKKIKKTKKKGG